MATVNELKVRANELRAGIYIDRVRGSRGEIRVEAPRDHHFDVGEPLHELVSIWDTDNPNRYARITIQQAIDDMAVRLASATVEPCTDECEWWGSENERVW